ncbi:hybrid sensor histidine kinase/response regulator [Bacteroidia bacterium]|nr:hybrid sensor histidine kinase/response regulator [Bacteroidia bacterium]
MGRHILIAIFALLSLQAAALPSVRFKTLSVDDGLSQNTVLAIAEDANRCIWVGTSDGLNRWDGYRFTVYRHVDGDSSSLGNNFISSLRAEAGGRLWIGTASGLSRYDALTGRFVNYSLPGRNMQVFAIDAATEGRLLLATDVGLIGFDRTSGRFDKSVPLSGVSIYCLCRYGDNVLVGTTEGLYIYSQLYKTVARIMPELERQHVTHITPDPEGGFWIATRGGLWRADATMRIIARYNRSGAGAHSLTSNNVRTLGLDSDGRLWVGTTEGLFIYNQTDDRFTAYAYSYDDPTSISHNSVRSIFMDSQGGMWLGTYYGGLSYWHPMAFRFHLLRHQPHVNSLSDNMINCIAEDGDTGCLWIGTNDAGLNFYDVRTGLFKHYSTSDGLRSENVKTVLADGPTTMWIGTHAGGLSRLDRRSGRIATFTLDPDSHLRNSCYSILKYDDRMLWIGTLSGLVSFDKGAGKFLPNPVAAKHPRLASSIINAMYRDSRRRIWIGTNYGLYLYTPVGDRLTAFETMPTGRQFHVVCVSEDSGGTIWVGSKSGLFRYDEQGGSFEGYTTADGLPNDCVYSILEDRYNRLWMSTNRGLSCFSPKSGLFRNYLREDGISSNQFNLYAACRTAWGAFYFGGINGITWFGPEEITDNPFAPAPRITGITVSNRRVATDLASGILCDSLGNLTSVRMPSRDNMFSVEFVVTNPLAGINNSFACKLEGFDDDWWPTRSTSVGYSNLRPGRYTLLVKAGNNDGVWCEQPARLDIRITPAWHQAALFKIACILAALAAAWGVAHFLSLRGKMRMQLRLEQMERSKIEEISQEKIRFYINMSHELRTPLTLILSPLQEIRGHPVQDNFVRRRIDYVWLNSRRLLHMVNQLLDYSKAELNMFRISVAVTDPEAVVANLFAMFEDNARGRDMNFILASSLAGRTAAIDASYVEMMVTNLLSNAFKFTQDGGTIRVGLDMEGDSLTISVRDSGMGIARDKIDKIFERFYRIDEDRTGTGIGLSIVKLLVDRHHGVIAVKSEPGRFTEFRISLPASIEAYAPEELAHEERAAGRSGGDISLFVQDASYVGERAQAVGHGSHEESILIVEDNDQIKQYLADSFSDRFNIFTASDGAEALAMLRDTEVDIVITDIMMPGMDGLELTRAIKQNIRTSHIMVVILTARDSMEGQMAGIEAGADDYLSKPFSLPILQAKIGNLLKIRYRLRHHYSRSIAEVDPDKITSNAVDGEFLRKAIKVVEENIGNEEFSSDDFARELCISRSSLHLKMKSITGEASTQFIRKIRFNRACTLLAEGKLSVAEVSCIVGFSSPSYFATSFKKHVGCLPTEYQRNRGAVRSGD